MGVLLSLPFFSDPSEIFFSPFLNKTRQAEMCKERVCLVQKRVPGVSCSHITSSSCQFLWTEQNWAGWKMLKETWFYRRQRWESVSFVCTRLLSVTPISLVPMLPCVMEDQLSYQWFCSKVAHFYSICCELCMISSSGDPRGATCHKLFCCAEKSIPVSQLQQWKTWTFDPDMLIKSSFFSKPISWVMFDLDLNSRDSKQF